MNVCGKPDRPEFDPNVAYERSYDEWIPAEVIGRLNTGYLLRLACGHAIHVLSHRVKVE